MKTNSKNILAIVISIFLTVFLVYGFIFGTFIPYLQMYSLKNSIRKSSPTDVSPFLSTSFIFEPKSNAQHLIRYSVFDFVLGKINEKNYAVLSPALDLVIKKMEEYVSLHPYFSNYQLKLARGYQKKWELTNDKSWLLKENEVYKKALTVNPGRQEILYLYAIGLAEEGRMKEVATILDTIDTTTPGLPDTHYFRGVLNTAYLHNPAQGLAELEISLSAGFNPNPSFTKTIYYDFLKYFYPKKDKTSVIVILDRLEKIDTQQQKMIASIKNEIISTGILPSIDLK